MKPNDIDGKILELGNRDYQIRLQKNLTKETSNLGIISYACQTITLDAELVDTPPSMLEVLIHEIQHGLNECFHLNKISDEEEFTDQVAVAWATLLRRNRWLAEIIYITAKG